MKQHHPRRDAEFYASMTSWQWGEGMASNAGGWIYAAQEDGPPW
jgi:hypothetical protein